MFQTISKLWWNFWGHPDLKKTNYQVGSSSVSSGYTTTEECNGHCGNPLCTNPYCVYYMYRDEDKDDVVDLDYDGINDSVDPFIDANYDGIDDRY